MDPFEKMKVLFDQAQCGIGLYYAGKPEAPIYFNKTFYRLTGYTKEEFEKFSAEDAPNLIFYDDLWLFPKLLDVANMPKGLNNSMYRFIRKDGKIIWIKINFSKIMYENMPIVFVTYIDLTKAKQSSDQMQMISKYVDCGIVIFNIENGLYTIDYANDRFFDLFGVTRNDYLSDPQTTLGKILQEDVKSQIAEQISSAVFFGKSGRLEHDLVNGNGKQISVSSIFSILPQNKNKSYLLLSVLQDITDIRRGEIKKGEERFRNQLVLEKTNTAVFEWNLKTDEFYSSELYNQYELSKNSLSVIWDEDAQKNFIFKDDITIGRNFLNEIIAYKPKSECVLRLKLTSGGYSWCKLLISSVFDEDGKLTKIIGAILDINKDMEKTVMLRELVNAIPGGVAIIKFLPAPKFLYYSDNFKKIGGWSDEDIKSELQDRDMLRKLISPLDYSKFVNEYKTKSAKGEEINIIYRSLQADGANKWLHMTATKIREEDGCPVYYAIFTTPSDETRLFRELTEDSGNIITLIEIDSGRIIYGNKNFRELICRTPQNVINGKLLKNILDDSDVELIKEFASELPDIGFYKKAITMSNGRYYLFRGKRLLWNGIPSFVMYINDQTDIQKRYVSIMKMLNNVPAGISIYEIVNRKIVPVYTNDGYYTMLGDNRENREKSMRGNLLTFVHRDDVDMLKKVIDEFLSGKKQADIIFRVLTGENKYIWIRLTGRTYTDDNGRCFIYCNYTDVNDEMDNESDLRTYKTIVDTAMKNVKASSFEYYPDKKTAVLTEAAQKQHGLDKELYNLPESVIETGFVHPDSIEDLRALFSGKFKGKGSVQHDIRVKTLDRGDWIWERHVLSPIFDQSGKLIKAVGTCIDVTEQKRTEEQYKAQMRDIASSDNSTVITKCWYNLSKNILLQIYDKNKRLDGKEYEVTFDEGATKAISSCISEETRKKLIKLTQRQNLINLCHSGKTDFSIEYQRTDKGNHTIWENDQFRLFEEPESGDVMCFIYCHDITRQKVTSEIIKAVVDSDFDYLGVIDLHKNDFTVYAVDKNSKTGLPCMYASDYEKEMADYAKKYIAADDLNESLKEMSIENIKKQLSLKEKYISCCSVISVNGSLRRKKRQLSYLDKEETQILLTRTDITDIYVKEQQQITALQKAMNESKKASQAKTDFLSRMSHDLRTPMNAIIGLTTLARDEINNPDVLKDYLEKISSSSNYLLALVNDCLDLEKITSGKMELHPAPTLGKPLINNITTTIEPLCKQKHIELDVKDIPTPYIIIADQVRLEQIYINLLSNAVKFTPEGGKIKMNLENISFHDGLLEYDSIVSDNGIGMSKEFQKHMFEPFEQEANAAQLKLQGTGLGLSIVKSIVDLMGGTISCESAPGEGTKFTLHFKWQTIDEDDYIKNSVSPEKDFGNLSGKHILLAEDHPLNTLIATKLLEKVGVIVSAVGNGKEALDTFAASQKDYFDAILMDIHMPIMGGLASTEAIRKLKRSDAATVPIIAMTANAFESEVKIAMDSGMSAHLGKPIDVQKLYTTLEAFISKRNK